MNTSEYSDIRRGKEALMYFHNEALKFPLNYRMTFGELTRKITEDSPRFFSYFGASLREANLTETEIERAITQIAKKGEGRLPKRYGDFFNFIVDKSSNISFVDAITEGTKETIFEIGKKAQGLGSETISSIQSSIALLPVALLGGILLYAYLKAKK